MYMYEVLSNETSVITPYNNVYCFAEGYSFSVVSCLSVCPSGVISLYLNHLLELMYTLGK